MSGHFQGQNVRIDSLVSIRKQCCPEMENAVHIEKGL